MKNFDIRYLKIELKSQYYNNSINTVFTPIYLEIIKFIYFIILFLKIDNITKLKYIKYNKYIIIKIKKNK